MITSSEMRRIAEEACTDEEYDIAERWLYEEMLHRAEDGGTMLALRVDMEDPTPNFRSCITRLKREFEESGYEFGVCRDGRGAPRLIEVSW